MDMWMMLELLIPCMQDAEEADVYSPARSEEREDRKHSTVFSERFVPHGKILAIRRTIHPFAASSNG
jgi:hypothetical protein